MISKFKFCGLSKNKSITCSVIGGSEEIFHPKVEMSKERFDALWKYCEGEWSEEKFALIQHDGLYEDGTPKNALFLHFEEN